MPVTVSLALASPMDTRKWGPTQAWLLELARAEQPGEVGDAIASAGGTAVALGAVAVGLLALVEAGVVTVPPEVLAVYHQLVDRKGHNEGA